jgi:hypothetical protein
MNIPALMLIMITIQSTRNVLRSCFVPVALRDRRVTVNRISDTK